MVIIAWGVSLITDKVNGARHMADGDCLQLLHLDCDAVGVELIVFICP